VDRVLAIAGNTFRETNRNRVMMVLLLFAVLLILGSVTMGKLSLQDEARIIQDLGLAAISLFGVIIAVYLGVTVVHREIEQKTVYFIIPKPIRREAFLLGKFAGMCLTLVIQIAVMSAVFALVLKAYDGRLTVSLAKALLLIQAEVLVVLSVALFFSSLTGPILAGFLSMALFVLGRSTDFIAQILRREESSSLLDVLLTAAYYALPDYHLFAVSGSVEQGRIVHNVFFTWGYVGWAMGYAALYIALMLGFTLLRFRRRDFT
jgi:ABC-type transport system involved in multi-copper enzyme maturation permease subunit